MLEQREIGELHGQIDILPVVALLYSESRQERLGENFHFASYGPADLIYNGATCSSLEEIVQKFQEMDAMSQVSQINLAICCLIALLITQKILFVVKCGIHK